MKIMSSRREILQALIAAPLLAACHVPVKPLAGPAALRMTLTGQALMAHPLCADPYDGLSDIIAEITRGDISLTDLEVAIKTPASGTPTRNNGFLHAASPTVLNCLREMGFDSLALSNNHAWDLNTAGVLATRDAVAAAGLAHAGTGANLGEASAPGTWQGKSRVALVAAASGKIPDGAAATDARPGVNELRLSDTDEVNPGDSYRILAAIESAALDADYAVMYLHNHQWGDDMTRTRLWVRNFGKDCVDAGADVFFCHGAPLLHGIEMFRGKPLLYGLGSLVFHSRTPIGYYPAEVWQSAIVHLSFAGGALSQMEIIPVSLNETGDDPAQLLQTRGRPRIASGTVGADILGRLSAKSVDLGTSLRIDGNRATLA
jgi:poly-gamma-glutamate capsule biosynthesis protein CapA/YwtB (metallophosphatase superfamily)